MTTEIKVPKLPESVADATLVKWHKKAGDAVARDENLADLETDKVVLEVPAPVAGILKEIRIAAGTTVTSDQLLAIVEAGAVAAAAPAAAPKAAAKEEAAPASKAAAPAAAPAAAASRPARPLLRHAASRLKRVWCGSSGRKWSRRCGDQVGCARACHGQRGSGGTARADDTAARAGGRAAGDSPGYAGIADHFQRSGSAGRAGAAHPLQGQVREEPRREARLLVLLREG